MQDDYYIPEKTAEEIYISVTVAKEEIWRRWNNKELRKKVVDFLGGDIPEAFQEEPRAVLFRNIASPDFEFQHFLDASKKLGLKPIVLEYTQDKFCTRNADKLGLCKLAIFEKKNGNGESIFHYNKIVDVKLEDNKKFCDIKTISGEMLVDFHHNLIKRNILDGVELFDLSLWIDRNGYSASEYYKKFLAFFICHGVLFENFLRSGEEDKFTQEVFMPAYDLVSKNFNLNPMIIEAIPTESMGDMYWWCYDNKIMA
jgi:hypothetical protein